MNSKQIARNITIWIGTLLSLTGCMAEVDAIDETGDVGAAAEELRSMPGQCGTHSIQADSIHEYVQSLEDVRLPSNSAAQFTEIDDGVREQVRLATAELLGGDFVGAQLALDGSPFEVRTLRVPTGIGPWVSPCFWVMRPTPGGAAVGHAVLLVRPNATGFTHDLVIEIPHPDFDGETEHQGAFLFESGLVSVNGATRWLHSRALVIAGAHRCADLVDTNDCNVRKTTLCNASGNTTPVNYPVSDPAHAQDNAFFGMHQGAMDVAGTIAVQLHTNNDFDLNGDILVSNGSVQNLSSTNDLAWQLFQRLDAIAPALDVRTCNDGTSPTARYCGRSNVEAMFNARHGACGNGAWDENVCNGLLPNGCNQRFVHIEQNTFANHAERDARTTELVRAILGDTGAPAF